MIKVGEHEVNILGTNYNVMFGNKRALGMSEENAGECRVFTKLILVNTDDEDCTSEELEVRTQEIVAHEVLHAYINEAGVSCGNGEEVVCDFFMKNWRKINNTILDILDKFQCI